MGGASSPRSATGLLSGDSWRRFVRAAWIQHRGAVFAFVLASSVLAVAMIVEFFAQHHAYAAFANAGCGSHDLVVGFVCNDGLPQNTVLGGSAEFKVLGVALMVWPLVAAVFLSAPLVAREFESGTFRFAWTQGVGRTRFEFATVVLMGVVVTTVGVALGLLYGSAYAHLYQVMQAPSVTQYQLPFFVATWWLLPVWTFFGLSVGLLVGIVVRRLVSAMVVTGVVVGGCIAANHLVMPYVLTVGYQVHRLVTSGSGLFYTALQRNTPAQAGWGLPAGSWVIRAWSGGGTRHVLNFAYQPPGHFWLFQGVEGVVLLALASGCVAVALHWLRKRVSA